MTVVGCAFRDIKRVENEAGENAVCCHGGVGRNIAENLGRLGLQVGFVSLSEPGDLETEFRARLHCAGVRWRGRRVPGGFGLFEVTLDAHGDLLGSRAHVPPLELLDWLAVSRATPWLRQSSYIVLETGLDAGVLRTMIRNARQWGVPVCGAMTRVGVPNARAEVLRGLSCLTLNQAEASRVAGYPVTSREDAAEAGRLIARFGIGRVALTMGSAGVIVTGRAGIARHFPALPSTPRDGTGAGDAFAAGLVAGLALAHPFHRSVQFGLTLAAKTVETFETVGIRRNGAARSTAPRRGASM